MELCQYLVVLNSSKLLYKGTQCLRLRFRLTVWCQLSPVALWTKTLLNYESTIIILHTF